MAWGDNRAQDLSIFLKRDARDGFTVVRSVHAQVREKLILLIMLNPGERIANSEMGVGLSRFLFDTDGFALQNNISVKIQEQVSQYLPFVEISDIDFNFGEEYENQNQLGLSISYAIPSLLELIEPEYAINGEEILGYRTTVSFNAVEGDVQVSFEEEPLDTTSAAYRQITNVATQRRAAEPSYAGTDYRDYYDV